MRQLSQRQLWFYHQYQFGFTISTKKTEVMHQPAPRKMYHEPHIYVHDEPLQSTYSFTYVGSTISREANIDVEVNNRLSKANSAFGRLRKKVWDRRGISQETKPKVYMAVVLTVLIYACESWAVHSRHARKFNHFHTTCLINGLFWASSGKTWSLTQKCSHE